MKKFLILTTISVTCSLSAQTIKGPIGGTTLEKTIKRVPVNPTNRWIYSTLSDGPGEPFITRKLLDNLPDPLGSHPLVAFAHFTDPQIMDHRATARLPALDSYAYWWNGTDNNWTTDSAYRPMEMLTGHTADAAIRAIRNHKNSAPATGLPLSFVLVTGDLTDNTHFNEFSAAKRLLNGETYSMVSGDPNSDEGDLGAAYLGLSYYWHPDGRLSSFPGVEPYADNGFPNVPNLYRLARQPFKASGFALPWYLALGNHDAMIQGNIPINTLDFTKHFPGSASFTIQDWAYGTDILTSVGGLPSDMHNLPNSSYWAFNDWINQGLSLSLQWKSVPKDPQRQVLGALGMAVMFTLNGTSLDHPFMHGFKSDGRTYYTIPSGANDIIKYIAIDTNASEGPNGSRGADGVMSAEQMVWLESELKSVSSRYRANLTDGNMLTNPGVQDKLIVIYGHHPIDTFDSTRPDGANLRELLLRYPNVIMYVTGHTHSNSIKPQVATFGSSRNGFFEITTASPIDPPSQSRLIEVERSDNGMISIYTTMLDLDAPLAWGGDSSPKGLASLGRELAWNDPQEVQNNPTLLARDPEDPWRSHRAGKAPDRNTRLILPAPFNLTLMPQPNAGPTLAVAQSTYSANTLGSHPMEVFGVDPSDKLFAAAAYATPNDPVLEVTPFSEGPSQPIHTIATATFDVTGITAQFGTTASGQVVFRPEYIPNGSGWSTLPGNLNTVAATVGGDGKMRIFGTNLVNQFLFVSNENYVSNGYAQNLSFGPFLQLTSRNFASVYAATNLNGKTQLFLLDQDGNLWTMSSTTAAAVAYTNPIQMNGQSLIGGLKSLSVARNLDGRLELFGTNSLGEIYHRSQVSPGAATWTAWDLLDGLMARVAAARSNDGRIQLWAINKDGLVFHREQTAPNSLTVGSWNSVPGLLRP